MQTGFSLILFQDKESIRAGEQWSTRIQTAIASSQVFVCAITPSFLQSSACREEVGRFLKRESSLGRDDLIVPLLYAPTPELDISEDEIARTLSNRQRFDLTALRFKETGSMYYRSAIADLIVQLVDLVSDLRECETDNSSPEQAATGTRTSTSGHNQLIRGHMQLLTDSLTSYSDLPSFLDFDDPVRLIYVVQTVVGDACGASIRYRLRAPGGIDLLSSPVELREGRFNITAAFGPEDNIRSSVLEHDHAANTLQLEVLDLPAHCATESKNATLLADLSKAGDSRGRIIVDMRITCHCPSL